ncbi:hypothetical protein Ahu01nite_040760 [Winogradskya humida]|uniref:Flagellar biosynthesis protein FlhF n=1 Tax=Winogradskya humida TaxID=113566 RepID=A0ABQ3ZQW9_9ACTN|nr:hypothetical protein Ahu01nite_040760 [Actinoplanes humidus]
MPTRVLLEGPAIEPLLAQVRDEYGSSVRIISADKVRSGGFGGFFAKQHYELSVEVPDPDEHAATPRRPAPADDGPQTLEQLLARAESRDRIAHDDGPAGIDRAVSRGAGMDDTVAAMTGRGPSLGGSPSLGGPSLGSPSLGSPSLGGPSLGGGGGLGLGGGSGLGGPFNTDGPGASRGLSDPQTAFAELMANLDRAESYNRPAPRVTPPPPPAAAAEPERPESPTVRPFRPAQATGSPVNGGSAGGVRPLPPVPSLAELMGGLGVNDSQQAPPTPAAMRAAQNPAPPRTPAEAYGLAPTSPATTSLVEQLGGLGLDRPVSAIPATHIASPMAQPPATIRHQHYDTVQQNLMKVGMPEELAGQIVGGDTYAGVLSVLASRPMAPGVPDAPGEILVLAGDFDHAVPIGKRLCEQSGIDQAHLLMGGPTAAGTGMHSSRILGDPETARTKAEKLQSADHAWIVVVDATVGRTDPIWVTDMCAAIGATAVWAVVDATRKTADTARHLRALGDVEALVVHGVDITSDPATVLGLDLPIVSLDGKPATPHSWAAMLCARIAADVVPMAALPRRPARRG